MYATIFLRYMTLQDCTSMYSFVQFSLELFRSISKITTGSPSKISTSGFSVYVLIVSNSVSFLLNGI